MGNHLVNHARTELNLLNEDPEIVDATIKMVEIFSRLGHSGASAAIHTSMISQLLRFQNLAPLTDNPEEWTHHDGDTWGNSKGIWQNNRNSEAFSEDGGKTYYLLSEGQPRRWWSRKRRTGKLHTSKAY